MLADLLAEKWLTTKEIAAACRVSPTTVRDWIEVGLKRTRNPGNPERVRLQARRVGHLYRVTEEALARFLAACDERGDLQ